MTMLDRDGIMITRIRTPANGHGMWVDIHGNMYTAGNDALVAKYNQDIAIRMGGGNHHPHLNLPPSRGKRF